MSRGQRPLANTAFWDRAVSRPFSILHKDATDDIRGPYVSPGLVTELAHSIIVGAY